MERITARWPDGRSVTYWDREVTGDATIVNELNQRARITGPGINSGSDWRRNGISFMAASSAVRAPEVPVFEAHGVSGLL
jgi:hypothetical protein